MTKIKIIHIILAVFLMLILSGCAKKVELPTLEIVTLTVEVNPSGAGSVSPSSGYYQKGNSVTISAKAEDNMAFDNWSGDASGSGTSIDVLMDSNKKLIANFLPLHVLETTVSPVGMGTVSPSRGTYKEGTKLTLIANAVTGYMFDSWSGDLAGSESSAGVIVDSDKLITANFKLSHALKVDIQPAGAGTVTPSRTIFKEGETAILTANPSVGYRFGGWTGDISGSTSTVTITMDADKSITASFLDNVPPADVRSPVSLVDGQTVKLSWLDPTDSDFTKVLISFDGGGSPVEVPKGTRIATINGLEGQKTYTFTLQAVDMSGNKSKGVQVTATTAQKTFAQSTDYFKISDGWGISYQVVETYPSINAINRAWVVSQYNKVRADKAWDYLFTVTQDGSGGRMFPNSCLGGYLSYSFQGIDLTTFGGGYPVANQGNFIMVFALPKTFNIGDSWSSFNGRLFQVDKVEPQVINGVNFPDCIKVTINTWSETDPYMKGDGYYILAKDTGIIKLVFNRVNGSKVTFDYITSKQFDEQSATAILNSIVIY